MEFKIEKTVVYGLNKSIIASGNAMRIEMSDNAVEPNEKDMKRAFKLGSSKQGEGHDNFLNGIIVQFDLYAHLQRRHISGYICPSKSCLRPQR